MEARARVSLLTPKLSVNIIFWDIRGLNQPHKQVSIKKTVNNIHPDILGIVVNKVIARNFDTIYNSCFINWDCIHHTKLQRVGRCLVLLGPFKSSSNFS